MLKQKSSIHKQQAA